VHRELHNGVLSNFRAVGLGVPHSEVDGCKSLALATATALGLVLGLTNWVSQRKNFLTTQRLFEIPKPKKSTKS
jgi:hypothetical protein